MHARQLRKLQPQLRSRRRSQRRTSTGTRWRSRCLPRLPPRRRPQRRCACLCLRSKRRGGSSLWQQQLSQLKDAAHACTNLQLLAASSPAACSSANVELVAGIHPCCGRKCTQLAAGQCHSPVTGTACASVRTSCRLKSRLSLLLSAWLCHELPAGGYRAMSHDSPLPMIWYLLTQPGPAEEAGRGRRAGCCSCQALGCAHACTYAACQGTCACQRRRV